MLSESFGRSLGPPIRSAVHPAAVPEDRRHFSYVVIDEIESSFVGLSVSPWPVVDEVGRLRFGPGRSRSVGASRSELERFLGRHRLPRRGARRPIRIGDVFAVAVTEPLPDGEVADPASWIDPPVYDITVDARDVWDALTLDEGELIADALTKLSL